MIFQDAFVLVRLTCSLLAPLVAVTAAACDDAPFFDRLRVSLSLRSNQRGVFAGARFRWCEPAPDDGPWIRRCEEDYTLEESDALYIQFGDDTASLPLDETYSSPVYHSGRLPESAEGRYQVVFEHHVTGEVARWTMTLPPEFGFRDAPFLASRAADDVSIGVDLPTPYGDGRFALSERWQCPTGDAYALHDWRYDASSGRLEAPAGRLWSPAELGAFTDPCVVELFIELDKLYQVGESWVADPDVTRTRSVSLISVP